MNSGPSLGPGALTGEALVERSPQGAPSRRDPGPGAAATPERLRLAGGRRSFVRAPADRTQRLRRAFQLAFLALNLAIGVQFWFFVHSYESAGTAPYLPRPPGIEGWLPIAALMNLKVLLATGELPRRHPAGLFLLLAFLAITFLFRKAFCSWLCPVGTLSEGLWKLGRHLFGRTFALPRWLDRPLRALKYLLLAFFLWAVANMSAEAIRAFLESPYGIVADVRMLNFFRDMGATTAIVLCVLAVASILVQNFWCRYLCPYGALHGLVAWLSPVRIRRDPLSCIDCARCARTCPSQLPVDVTLSVASPECTACLECVAACPVRGALALSAPRQRALPGWALGAGIALVFLALVGFARLTGHWHTPVDPKLYHELIPRASEFDHP